MSRYHPILLYDGECAMCNRLTEFVLRRDAAGQFRFASLQSHFAQSLLAGHHATPDPDTMYLVVSPDTGSKRLLTGSDAALQVLRALGGGWKVAALAAGLLPRRLREGGYRFIARNRYRLGRRSVCPLPSPAWRGRFLDIT